MNGFPAVIGTDPYATKSAPAEFATIPRALCTCAGARRVPTFDRNLSPVALRLRCRHHHFEYSVFEPSLDLLGVDAFGQWNTAIKLSIPALAPSYPALVRFLLPFALALDYESFVCDFYLDILGLKSRQLGMDQVITVALGTRFWQPHRIDREELIRELNESYTEFNNVIAVYQIA